MKYTVLGTLLFCVLQWREVTTQCDVTTKEEQKDFPDITKDGINSSSKLLGYQLSVEFTISSKEKKKTIFVKEYRDILNSKGRLDIVAGGKSSRFYYYRETGEAFDVVGEVCTSRSFRLLPASLNEAMDWMYDEHMGPSAMFLIGAGAWKSNRHNMNYMGQSEHLVAELKAQYWRMCNGRQTVDYYFTTDDHDDDLGLNLKRIPLRVQFYNSLVNENNFPQTYEILSFQPFVSDSINTFRIPSGIGCRRKENMTDEPNIPNFSDGSMLAFGEAAYSYGLQEDDVWNYYSTFWVAHDVGIHHIAYSYTPWGNLKKDDDIADGYVRVTYDTVHKYKYTRNIDTHECTIARGSVFDPLYELPKYGDSISLFDPMMLLPNDEFSYITDGKDRGYDVNIFETMEEDYPLQKKTVPKLIVNHNYLKDNEIIDGNVEVKNRPVSMKLKFYADKKKPHTEELTLNIYEFSTKVEHRHYIFDVHNCFKNDDDYLWIVLGFPADPRILDQIKTQIPVIERNLLHDISMLSELNPLRFPIIMTDLTDMVYIKIFLIDKPPVILDYLVPEDDTALVDVTDAEGIMEMEDCANACLETEVACWGFAYCGTTCFFGTGNAKPVKKKGCQLYRRFNNDTYVPSKEGAAKSIETMVQGNQIRIAVKRLEDQEEQPIFLEAKFFSVISSAEESDDMFRMLGKMTNPRMRVAKSGYKLANAGETIKNFGSLRYDQCQSLCLDYRRCETVSYCAQNSQCILSTTYFDDLPNDNVQEDNTCNLLARKYTDHFDRSPGKVLSSQANQTLDFTSPEECARACLQLDCLSFDLCANEQKDGCRLHIVQYMDQEKNETDVKPAASCIHYSKKFRYQFQKEDNKKSVGVEFLVITNVTIEQCAKTCIELNGNCFGYDFCSDKFLTATTCTLLTDDPRKYSTTYSAICSHYLRGPIPAPVRSNPETNEAWVGVVCFFLPSVTGVLLAWGVTHFRKKNLTSEPPITLKG